MKFIKIFFSIILSIFFTVALTLGILAYSMDSFISKENIKNMLAGVDYEKYLEPDIKDTMIRKKYSGIPEVKELLDRLIEESIEYMIYDKDIPKVSDADIEKIVNSNYYEDFLDIKLPSEKKLEYEKVLKDSYITVNEKIASNIVNIKSQLFQNDILKVLLSEDFLPIIYISLIALSILIIIFSWSWYRPFYWIGGSMIIAGGSNMLLNIIVDSILTTKLNYYLRHMIADDLLTNWLNNSLIVLIIGSGLFYIYSIINNKFYNIKEKSV